MFQYRILSKPLRRAAKTFPAIVVTGPRQSGKTTLLKALFKNSHEYFSLENPDVRLRAKNDPASFLENFRRPVILDEIQYVPELLPYVKTAIDQNRKAGRWIITGSQSFPLMQGITESLAGRAAVLSLLPFSFAERVGKGRTSHTVAALLKQVQQSAVKKNKIKVDIASVILRGNFPEIASNPRVDGNLWCGSYITTYLERDIRNLTQVGDLNQFERFVRMCAVRTGQILNLSEMARDLGISVPTAKKWLSLLETGYQIFLLYPYYRNLGKRLVKSPKLYFNDTALAAYLLGITDKRTLVNSPHFAHLFETLIVTDFWKRFLHFGERPALYYLKTRDGLEVDMVVEAGQKLHLFEVKSSKTVTPHHIVSLQKARRDFGREVAQTAVISQTPENFTMAKTVKHCFWQDLLSI